MTEEQDEDAGVEEGVKTPDIDPEPELEGATEDE